MSLEQVAIEDRGMIRRADDALEVPHDPSWQDPNGYPGGGIHERAKKLASRKPGDPHPFVDPETWDARAKRQLETARKVLAAEQAKAGAPKAD